MKLPKTVKFTHVSTMQKYEVIVLSELTIAQILNAGAVSL